MTLVRKCVFAAVAALFLILGSPSVSVEAQAARPKLVVFVVVDQMRGDYPVRYAGLLEHGLKRLTTRGAWFRNGAYPYFNTVTCVGHTTIGTGTLPYKHGLIGNGWWDRATEKTVTCNSDPDSLEVSYGTSSGAGDSAVRMMMPTLAEVMRGRLKSRVATMSMKARSAIGLAGHQGDFVTWLGDRGAWETSNMYTTTPVPWFVGYLKGNPITDDADKTWERALPEARYQYTDAAPGERGSSGWTTTFPHPLGRAGDAAFMAHWLQSPFPDDYLGRMAEAAVSEMKLGTEDRIDFLGVSFSMLDSVGHAFGPRSHEAQDVIVRLDRTLGRLLDFLDEKVGVDNYVLAFSADHGVADIPEQIPNAGRIPGAAVRGAIEAVAKKALGGDGPFIAAMSGADVYFKPGIYDRLRSSGQALKEMSAALAAVSGVDRILTSTEISSESARKSKNALIRAAALSYYPGRSGDLIVVPKENWLMTAGGTTHGTAYRYDQQVPVLLYGAGIQPGVRDDAATPADLASTIASIVGVQLPSPDGRVLTSALKKR
jgi:predicted AlkP superfamily pyrophosphatase or phosphodiesterase